MPYRIEYSPAARDHMKGLPARQRALVADAVDEHLTQQPTQETRNRKRLRPNHLAPFELRVRNLRVFYDVAEDPEPVVLIIAVGTKVGNRFLIEGEQIEL